MSFFATFQLSNFEYGFMFYRSADYILASFISCNASLNHGTSECGLVEEKYYYYHFHFEFFLI